MAYEIRPNSGSLFRNDKKVKDTDPTHTGQADIGGTLYWGSAWVKEAKSGRSYFDMKYTEKQSAGSYQAKSKAAPEPQASKDFQDSIPF